MSNQAHQPAQLGSSPDGAPPDQEIAASQEPPVVPEASRPSSPRSQAGQMEREGRLASAPEASPNSPEARELDRAMMDGATIQLPVRPWVDEVPDPVTPVGGQSRAELGIDSPAAPRVSEAVPVATLPSPDTLCGRVLANRFLLEELLSETEGGLLFRAYHLGLDRPVAVQILPRGLACSEEKCEEVSRLAQAAVASAPESMVEVLDFGILNDGWPYTVSSRLEGQLLSTALGADQKFVLRRVLHLGQQIAGAVSKLHSIGGVHGLLRPEFVQITNPGTPSEIAKLGGVGLLAARGEGPQPPRRNALGSPHFVSPEQAASKAADARSDVYAIGVLLYRMMTGALPFHEGDFDDILCQHLDDEPLLASSHLESPGALAKAMDAVIHRCLQKEPEQRYQQVSDLCSDLSRLEAAASRSKRRPMQEIAKPQSTIHTPAARTDGPKEAGAKVIVGQSRHQDPAARTEVRASIAPLPPAKVSRFQETVRISPQEVERAIARRRGGWSRLRTDLEVTWERLSIWMNDWLARTKTKFAKQQSAAPQQDIDGSSREPHDS